MEQFEQSLDMMRNGCAPKFKVKIEQLDKLRYGSFEDPDPELKVQIFVIKLLNFKIIQNAFFVFVHIYFSVIQSVLHN